MRTIVSTGKNVEKAIEEGLKELGVTQEQVDIKILDEGGIFRKAKVELTLDKDVEEKAPAKEEVKEEKETKKKEKATAKKEKKEEKTEEKVEKKEEKPAKKSKEQNLDEAIELGSKFLTTLFKELNDEIIVTSTKVDGGINYNIKGEKVSSFIGYRGETLNALQYIVNMVIKNAGYKNVRAFLDVENYKEKRQETLISLAKRLAKRAIEQNKEIKLEPMNAYERRIIHTALTDSNVETHSEGEEPNRYLVITPKNLNK
jgi:spoIIIJ-associated protein